MAKIPAGLLATEVAPDSPAAAAGLKPGDLLVEVDGEPAVPPVQAAQTASTAVWLLAMHGAVAAAVVPVVARRLHSEPARTGDATAVGR